jgi:hypothetical protein
MTGKKKEPTRNGGVGYGRPPVHSRFRKGQSGNPTGNRQPDKAEGVKHLVRQEAERMLTIREGDKVIRMPAVQAVFRSQIASAVKGNVAAQRAVLKVVQDLEASAAAASAGDASKKLKKDLNDMTDEELLDLLQTTEFKP